MSRCTLCWGKGLIRRDASRRERIEEARRVRQTLHRAKAAPGSLMAGPYLVEEFCRCRDGRALKDAADDLKPK